MTLEAILEAANTPVRELVSRFAQETRLDTAGLPSGALGWVIAEAVRRHPERRLAIVAANLEEAYLAKLGQGTRAPGGERRAGSLLDLGL